MADRCMVCGKVNPIRNRYDPCCSVECLHKYNKYDSRKYKKPKHTMADVLKYMKEHDCQYITACKALEQ